MSATLADLLSTEAALADRINSAAQRHAQAKARAEAAGAEMDQARERIEKVRALIKEARARVKCSFEDETGDVCTDPAAWLIQFPEPGEVRPAGRFAYEVSGVTRFKHSCHEHLFQQVDDYTDVPALVSRMGRQ
jgi:hypothetical protein